MHSVDTHGTFEEALDGSSPAVRRLARDLRGLIEDVYPGVTEVPWPRQGVVGYGVGPKKMTEHFGYIGAYTDHVNLGFNHGAALDDPDGLLEGMGKRLRHVQVRSAEQLDDPALRALIEAAIREREDALGRRR